MRLRSTESSFTPAEGFRSRLEAERQLIECVRKNGERWPFSSGLYKTAEHSLINHKLIPPSFSKEMSEPPTFHDHLKTAVNKLLQTKPVDEPIVVLDIGGGAGLTWGATAAQFRQEVMSGKILFIVSNLSWSLKQFIRPSQTVPGTELVQYINSTFRKLCGQPIPLPNGKTLTLRKTVDLAHENQSLTRWSQVPELDILSICGLLSPYGSYFISHPTTPCKFDLVADPIRNRFQREQAVGQTCRLLQERYGLKHVTQVEDGEYAGIGLLYSVYRKPEAPPIEV